MDPIATLLLARTHTVVLDADRVASAATRPARDDDIDRFEAVLTKRGFLLSLDLAMTLRRMPHDALSQLQRWMLDTLPHHTPPPTTEHPCPWCARITTINALDPCGHFVCAACWRAGAFAGCPICHHRVSPNAPFMPARERPALQLLHLAFDLSAVARARFERLVARTTTLLPAEREELERMIDTMGPKAAMWLPKHIAVRETMAIALARLWMVAPDRTAMMKATHGHLASATDVLRIAAVLMGASPDLVEPLRLASIPRNMRRAVLEALEHLPDITSEMRRCRGLWKRVGERLHPGESTLPNVTAAFAALRGNAKLPTWAGRVEAALAAKDAEAAATLLAERPDELVRRVGHLARLGYDPVPVLKRAAPSASPVALLRLAAYARTRLPAVETAVIEALLARAAARRNYARAVIDRGLAEWDLAAIHAAARANTIYVRDGAAIASYKRRDGEPHLARLARLHAGEHDGVSKLPPANAPTWFALEREDVALPKGSEGYARERGTADGITRLAPDDLVTGLG
ncbi:MAG: hypothetical protein M4D80_07995 [Myxococcota bacterium]|nr:hypothetical protein [Myxococcota bacterium]